MKNTKKKILIISLDAFRFDYLQQTVFLKKLAENNSYGELKTIFGYTGIGAAINIGLYPKDSGVWLEYIYDEQNSPFRFAKYIWFFDTKFGRLVLNIIFNLFRYLGGRSYLTKTGKIPVKQLCNFRPTLDRDWGDKNAIDGMKTLFDVLRERKIEFLYYDWPISFSNHYRSLTFGIKNNDESKINRLIKDKNKSNLFWLRIWDLDSVAHQFGPDSREVKKTVKKIDQLCQKLMEEFGRENEVEFLFWADHGMVRVKEEVDLTSVVENINYPYFLDSTLARFWPTGREKKQKLINDLESIDGGHVLTESYYQKYKLDFTDKRYGEVVFAADAGRVIMPNFYNIKLPQGMHGYDPDLPEQKGLYISSLNKGREDKKMVEMYNEILNLINK